MSVGLVLVCIAAIGQTSYLYFGAFVGIAPSERPEAFIGSFLWPLLIGILIAALARRRKLIGGALGLVGAGLVFGGAFAVAERTVWHETGAWTQSRLTPEFMREITKDQCMEKTINSIRACDSRDCLTTMAGVLGDCVHFATGDHELFCESYRDTYMEPNCTGEDRLSYESCVLLQITYDTQCTEQGLLPGH